MARDKTLGPVTDPGFIMGGGETLASKVTRGTFGMKCARIFSQISKIASTVIWIAFWRYFSSAVCAIDSFTPGATTDHNCLDPNSDDISVSRKLFDLCLEKVIPLSNDARLQESIQEYQQACKEARHKYFVKFANWVLGLLKSVELPGLCGESTSQIIFHLNDQRTTDKDGSKRFPDIVVVPLSTTKRVRTEPNKDGKGSRNQLEWADVLVSTEIKCHLSTLDLQPLGACNTVLRCPIDPLPTCIKDPDMASTLSVSPTTRTENSAGTPDHQKRRAEHPEQTNSEEPAPNRIKARDDEKKRLNEHITDALVRSAEMPHCCGRRHAFGLITIDAMVWIWRFDRQDAIQSTGINFIEDLPRFMVFLFAIQRFPLAGWGFDVKLDPSIPLRHHSNTPLTQQPAEYEVDGKDGKFKVGFGSDIMATLQHIVFSLRGNSTTVSRVTCTPEQLPLVAKLNWPNQDRPNAAEIIERARKIPGLSDHLPYVFGSRDMDSIGTRRISDKLGISPSSPRPPRVFRTIILESLMPITKLTGDHFVFAWLECIRCHYILWENGIRHLDLSLANLMARVQILEGKQKYFGVVKDWDLGDLQESRPKSHKDLSKIILFTSLDLLNPVSPKKQVVQRYSHDLESFFWILIWVFLAVQEEKVKPTEKVAGWLTGDPVASSEGRSLFVLFPRRYAPHLEWRSYWVMARKITKWFSSHIEHKNEVFDENEPPNQNETPKERKELLRGLLEIVEERYGAEMPSSPEIEGL